MEKGNGNGLGFSTRGVHAGQQPAPGCRAIMTPIYQSSTFVQESPGRYVDGYDYSRTKNPTRTALEENLAALEEARHGVCFSSGCAAGDAVLHLLRPGDEVISADDVYGGTFRLFEKIFQPFGITFHFVDLTDAAALEAALNDKVRLVWIESPTNPLLKVIDIAKVSAAAKRRGAMVLVDNTFASPYLQNPLNLGADLVLHSTTKYIGGHSDLVGGAVLTNDDELADRLRYIQNAVGAVPSPFECFLVLRSTKTLAIRMERHCENALTLARRLEADDRIEKVIYPWLESHPQHEVARRQMRGGGGMISAVIRGGLEPARTFLESVSLFSLAESLGGVESLIEHPAIMTHATIPPETRASLGISDGLVRLSVGIEDVADLQQDLERALDAATASNRR